MKFIYNLFIQCKEVCVVSRKGQGFIGTILLLIRLLITTVFTLAVFTLLLGFVTFRCMHSTGSHMLAQMLSSYPIVDIIPKIYYLPSELTQILSEQEVLPKDQLPNDTAISDPTVSAESSADLSFIVSQ